MSRGAVVIGASSGVGRAIAEDLARLGHDLVIGARNRRDLDAVAADLSIRFGVTVLPWVLDLTKPEFEPDRLVAAAARQLGRVDLAVFTAGMVDPRDTGLAEPEVIAKLIKVNYLAVVQLIAAFARLFLRQSEGQIVAISSIAAAAPRGRNTVYSSAKAGLEVFVRGLRHNLFGSRVGIQVYALGYVDTQMAFGQKLLFPVASPERVARHITANLGGREGVHYYPRFWSPIARMMTLLPAWLHLRLKY